MAAFINFSISAFLFDKGGILCFILGIIGTRFNNEIMDHERKQLEFVVLMFYPINDDSLGG